MTTGPLKGAWWHKILCHPFQKKLCKPVSAKMRPLCLFGAFFIKTNLFILIGDCYQKSITFEDVPITLNVRLIFPKLWSFWWAIQFHFDYFWSIIIFDACFGLFSITSLLVSLISNPLCVPTDSIYLGLYDRSSTQLGRMIMYVLLLIFILSAPSVLWTNLGWQFGMLESILTQAQGYLVIYSITSKATLERTTAFMDLIQRVNDGTLPPCILVGNKCDLEITREVSKAEGKAMADRFQIDWLEASAKNRINSDDIFHRVLRKVMANSLTEASSNTRQKKCTIL